MKIKEFIVNYGFYLIDDTVDSDQWRESLSKYDLFLFDYAQADLKYGPVRKDKGGFMISTGEHEYFYKGNYIDYFVVDYFEEIDSDYQPFSDVDLYKDIRKRVFDEKLFKGYFSFRADFFDRDVFNKINGDFLSLFPGSWIYYYNRSKKISYKKFNIKEFEKTEHQVIWNVPYSIESGQLDQYYCIKFHEYLEFFSQGEDLFNKLFKNYYYPRKNMYFYEKIPDETGLEVYRKYRAAHKKL